MRRILLTCSWISLAATPAPRALAQEPAAEAVEVTGRMLEPQERRPVEIRLQPSRTAVLEVRDWLGRIPEQLYLHHLSEQGDPLRSWTLEPVEGVFSVDGLSPGGNRLAIMTASSAPLHLQASAGQSLSLRLEPGAIIDVRTPWLANGDTSFRMSGPQGQHAWVWQPLAPQISPDGWVTHEGAVTYRARNLAPGRWKVTVRWPDGSETTTHTIADPKEALWLDLLPEKPTDRPQKSAGL